MRKWLEEKIESWGQGSNALNNYEVNYRKTVNLNFEEKVDLKFVLQLTTDKWRDKVYPTIWKIIVDNNLEEWKKMLQDQFDKNKNKFEFEDQNAPRKISETSKRWKKNSCEEDDRKGKGRKNPSSSSEGKIWETCEGFST